MSFSAWDMATAAEAIPAQVQDKGGNQGFATKAHRSPGGECCRRLADQDHIKVQVLVIVCCSCRMDLAAAHFHFLTAIRVANQG
jgi:hypothetical protein